MGELGKDWLKGPGGGGVGGLPSLAAMLALPVPALHLHSPPFTVPLLSPELSGDDLQGLVQAVQASPSDPAKRCVASL